MKVGFEAKAGITQVALFLPVAVGVLVVVGVFQIVAVLVESYQVLTWLHGSSIDFDTLMWESTFLRDLQGLASTDDPDALVESVLALMPPWSLYLSAWVQNLAMAGGCALLVVGAGIARRRALAPGLRLPAILRDGFAIGATTREQLAIGLFGGLVLMWLPAAVMDLVLRVVPLDNTSSELLSLALRASSSGELVFAVLTIAVAVPVFEELIFRGFLWGAGERWLPSWLVLVLTAVTFAAFHMSPAHVLGVLAHGLFLGWLRLTSRSVWPSVLAHMGNNGIAVAMIASGADTDEPTALPVLAAMAVVGAIGLAVASWAAWRWRVSPSDPSAR